MYPTYWENEEVKVIAHAPFERWAVIGFHPPDNENELYLKRIVGLPGEHIAYREGQLYINGKKIWDTFGTNTPDFDLSEILGFKTIPEGSYFVLGDNRNNSVDSRQFGLVPETDIVGIIDKE